tara:strand:+ start:55 stop:204 length:150 start_codon:yes stop_codon:yes gene_type:complete
LYKNTPVTNAAKSGKVLLLWLFVRKFSMTHVIKNFALVKPKIFDENNVS